MRRQRATIADQLSQVIEVIALGRRTGLLSIERTDDAGLEEGDIYFVNGEAIYASTGMQSGCAALETLFTWGACRFAFLVDIPRPVPNITPDLRGSRASQAGSIHRPAPGSRPGASQPERSGPLAGSPPTAQRSGPLASSSAPIHPSADGQRRGPASGAKPSGYGLSRLPQPPGHGPPGSPPGGSPSTPPLLVLTPYHRPKRAPNPQDIPRLAASYGLSWAHRALLLLADGEHNVAELARLSGRPEEEVVHSLADLLRLGLITFLS